MLKLSFIYSFWCPKYGEFGLHRSPFHDRFSFWKPIFLIVSLVFY